MSTLKVVVVRTGGFANVRRTAEVDDPDEAERLSAAAERAAAAPEDRTVRDGFVYEIRIVTAAGSRTVELSESQLGDDLRPRLRAVLAR